MASTSTRAIGISPCGCLFETSRRWRLLRQWRCPRHRDSYIRAEVLLPIRRCESCRRRVARYRVTFADGESWAVCPGCELPRPL